MTTVIEELRGIYPFLQNGQQETIKKTVDYIKSLEANLEEIVGTNLPEAPASATVKIVDPKTQLEWLFTIRAGSPDYLIKRLPALAEQLLERGYVAFDVYVDQRRAERENNKSNQPPQSSPESIPIRSAQPAGELMFQAEQLVATVNGGTAYWKVKGGKFKKFGVTIWPEILEEAGWDAEAMDPMKVYSLSGYTAQYILKEDGKADKVIRLSK